MMLNSKQELRRTAKQIAVYRNSSPDLISLALTASLARKIEPELLRTLRVKLSHHFAAENRPTVRTEAALWFSVLVESRGDDSLTLSSSVLRLLREELARDESLFEETHMTIDSF